MDPSSAQALASIQSGHLQAETLKERKEEVPLEFEKIFARHLVEEMTKEVFDMQEEQPMMQSQSMYQEHITDTLATHMAEQRSLGIADMVEHFWEDRLHDTEDSDSGGINEL